MKVMVILLVILAISLVVMSTEYNKERNERKRLETRLERINNKNLVKQGWTSSFGDDKNGLNYQLRSWDSGINWYACEYGKDWELIVLGNVDEVYPGLMKHLDGWDMITEHVRENGPLFSNGVTPKDVELLENVGFEVKQN